MYVRWGDSHFLAVIIIQVDLSKEKKEEQPIVSTVHNRRSHNSREEWCKHPPPGDEELECMHSRGIFA